MKAYFLPFIVAAALLTGCSSSTGPKSPTYESARSNAFIPANHQAADALLRQLDGQLTGSTLLIATLVNIDALDSSSTLGRLVSEQISARFTQAGVRSIEMKFQNNVYISQSQGEFMLTREIHELAQNYSAQAVVVGTYAESREFVFINLKVIQAGTNIVLAVHDYALPMDANVRSMLMKRRQ